MKKNNTLWIIITLIVALTFTLFLYNQYQIRRNPHLVETTPVTTPPVSKPTTVVNQPASDPANATYLIEGQSVTLKDGKHEADIPNSSAKIVTSIWGQPTMGDLTGDGVADAGVILVQESGGSGTFYYVAGAVNQDQLYTGTNAIVLGDRIAVQTYTIQNSQVPQSIEVNYADRTEDQSMADSPSVAVSRYFALVGNILTEVTPTLF